jgi:hypothetical protein
MKPLTPPHQTLHGFLFCTQARGSQGKSAVSLARLPRALDLENVFIPLEKDTPY